MNNDLISREALKKALHNFFDGKVIDEPAYILRDVFCYIDGAPTVETDDDKYLEKRDADAYESGYLQGHIEGYLKAEKDYARPQGEWLDVPVEPDLLYNTGIKFTCSVCGRGNCYGRPPYCMYCGASMKSKPSFYNTSGLTDEEEADRDAYEEAMRLDDEEGRGQA